MSNMGRSKRPTGGKSVVRKKGVATPRKVQKTTKKAVGNPKASNRTRGGVNEGSYNRAYTGVTNRAGRKK